MSTEQERAERADATPPRRRLPMSPVNVALVTLCLVGAIASFVSHQMTIGLALLVSGVLTGAAALFARRRSAGDLERVNALEYTDERDRAAAVRGLAVVGMAGLILSFAQVVVYGIPRDTQLGPIFAIVTLGVLGAVWFFANWYFVRRG